MEFSYLATALLVAEQVDPEGNQPIGWLAGGFTLLLFLIVALLLWSFTRMAKRARQSWSDDPDQPGSERGPDDPRA